MTFKMKNRMFDLLIDKDFITAEELAKIGFTKEEIDSLCKDKSLSLCENGDYTLGKVQGLMLYSYSLYKRGNLERYRQAVQACLRFYPDSCTASTLLFSEAIIENDYSKAFEYFEIMNKSPDSNNIKDFNFWLLLLSYVVDVPGEYIDKLSNLRLDDILINTEDRRYSDCDKLNEIRKLVFEGNFDSAIELIGMLEEAKNDKAYNKITRNLIMLAKENYHVDSNNMEVYYDLVVAEDYAKLIGMLDDVQSKRRFTFSEFCLYTLAKNMTNMMESGRVPKIKNCDDINFVEAIVKHNYELALQINRCASVRENCSKDEAVSLMLQRIIDKRDEIKFQRTAKQIGSNEFAKFYNDLMSNDIDNALEKLHVYLAKMGKSEYYSYIFSLIKLSLVDEDRAYVAPMLALSSIKNDDFYFDVSTYLQDFYFAFATKDYKRAIVYLNILSSSKDIGGVVAIDTTEMEKSLFDAIRETDINELDIVIEMPKVKTITDKMVTSDKKVIEESTSKEKVETISMETVTEVPKEEVQKAKAVEESKLDELSSKYSHLTTVIDAVIDGDNVVLLEPMNDEDTHNVLYLVSCIPDIEVSLVDSIDSENKHVMLRYTRKSNESVSGGELIRAGNTAYYEKRYADCIDCFEQFISCRGNPRSFIYAKLGLAYRALGTNDAYCNAIDYLTIATSKSVNDYDGDFDFTRIVRELKDICGYNGVRVVSDNEFVSSDSNEVQYIKNDKK